LKLHRLATANDRLRVAKARLPCARQGTDMNTAPDLAMPTTIAATEQTQAAAAPRIKLSSHGFSIDHPDPELGEQLMANALIMTTLAAHAKPAPTEFSRC
jgi:hypothetical protein